MAGAHARDRRPCGPVGARRCRVRSDANGDQDNRHTIAHVELVHPDDLGRFGEQGVMANMQMQWAELDSYTVDYTKPYIGPRRWRYLYPSGSIAAAGGTLRVGATGPWTRSTPSGRSRWR